VADNMADTLYSMPLHNRGIKCPNFPSLFLNAQAENSFTSTSSAKTADIFPPFPQSNLQNPQQLRPLFNGSETGNRTEQEKTKPRKKTVAP